MPNQQCQCTETLKFAHSIFWRRLLYWSGQVEWRVEPHYEHLFCTTLVSVLL